MPNYAQPLAAGGAAAGGGFMGTLGRLLEPLDYARQALWNVPGKLAEGDFAGAAPGLAGLAAGGALAATGVGIPLAMLGGSLVGGLGQGVGKQVDEERFEAPSASHLVDALGGDSESGLGQVAAMGLNALGDPLTYAGGIGLGGKGAQAGRHLENVALTRGPRYAGGAEKLMFGADSVNPKALADALGQHMPDMAWKDLSKGGERLAAMHADPNLSRLLGEIPHGSVPLGMGEEAMVFRTPQGGVVRMAGGPGALDVRTGLRNGTAAPGATINAPEILQPARDLPIGGYRVQHNPMVEMPHGSYNPDNPSPLWQEMEAATYPLDKSLSARGLNPQDVHQGNVGRTRQGNYVVTDPGSVLLPHDALPPEPITQATGGRFTNWLLDRLGADRSVQGEISANLAKGGAGQGLHLPDVREVGDMARRRLAQTPGSVAEEAQSPLLAQLLGAPQSRTPPLNGRRPLAGP